jgi:hypothetical protein
MVTPPPAGSPSIFDKLNDSNQYTGAQKEHFDSSGKGKGKAGRTQEGETVADISQVVVADRSGPRSRAPQQKKQVGDAIFDRLTDTSKFTGAHKERFDSDGQGKGKVGRTQEGDRVGDIYEIMGAKKRVNAAARGVVDHGSDTEDDASD